MGISRFVVHFEHFPEEKEVKRRLVRLTGLPLRFDGDSATLLQVEQPSRAGSSAELYWIEGERQPCLYVESRHDIGKNYVQVSVLYVLLQLGGKLENNEVLPEWAGKAWPPTRWSRMLAWLS